jgi:hypothetical protein
MYRDNKTSTSRCFRGFFPINSIISDVKRKFQKKCLNNTMNNYFWAYVLLKILKAMYSNLFRLFTSNGFQRKQAILKNN